MPDTKVKKAKPDNAAKPGFSYEDLASLAGIGKDETEERQPEGSDKPEVKESEEPEAPDQKVEGAEGGAQDETEEEEPAGTEAEEEPEEEAEEEPAKDGSYNGLKKAELVSLLDSKDAIISVLSKRVEEQRQGVEKLQKKLSDSGTVPKEAQEALVRMNAWNSWLEDEKTAPLAVSKMLAYYVKRHGVSLDEAVSNVRKAARGGIDPASIVDKYVTDEAFDDPEAVKKQLRGIVEELVDRLSPALTSGLELPVTATKPDDDGRPGTREDRAKAVRARFEEEFDEAKWELEAAYPGFKLTKEMALDALRGRDGMSVRDACVLEHTDKMASAKAKKAKEASSGQQRMVRDTGPKRGAPAGRPDFSKGPASYREHLALVSGEK